jgi:hypothetical protein
VAHVGQEFRLVSTGRFRQFLGALSQTVAILFALLAGSDIADVYNRPIVALEIEGYGGDLYVEDRSIESEALLLNNGNCIGAFNTCDSSTRRELR